MLSELQSALSASASGVPITLVEQQMRLAEFKTLVRSAERGQLPQANLIAVRRCPDLWELRMEWSDGTLVRVYFFEPSNPAAQTVAVLAHVKRVVVGDPATTRALQNEAMDQASHRVVFGRPNNWGLAGSMPLLPRPATPEPLPHLTPDIKSSL